MKYAKNIIVRITLAAVTILALGGSMAPTVSAEQAPVTATKKGFCHNKIANLLHATGWRGHSLRIAWAIVMRESRGHARSVSHTHDYGLFQINRAAYHTAEWWNEHKLLTPKYNASVAYRLSQGGKTWYPWGITGKGTRKPGTYSTIGSFNSYKKYYNQYPCTA